MNDCRCSECFAEPVCVDDDFPLGASCEEMRQIIRVVRKHFSGDSITTHLIENLIERMQKSADAYRDAENEHYGRDSTVSTFTWMHSIKRDYETFVEELDKIMTAVENSREVQS